ncbi:hypothetical protein CHISP_2911 [Chitinispirillum alkaliphilum]|nr:hypothetical protein CHISP_2911 [Chitinispirillum alkaliphilum]
MRQRKKPIEKKTGQRPGKNALVSSTAYYKREDDISFSFVYTALLSVDVEPKMKRAGKVSARPGALRGKNTTIAWEYALLDIDIATFSNCRLFTARADIETYGHGLRSSVMDRVSENYGQSCSFRI